MAEESITDIHYLVRSLQAKIDELENKIKIMEKENASNILRTITFLLIIKRNM